MKPSLLLALALLPAFGLAQDDAPQQQQFSAGAEPNAPEPDGESVRESHATAFSRPDRFAASLVLRL
jgi:hypothetical protein